MPSGHIGHNKFVVYADASGKPQAVLAGSTNWTDTGLCGQANNAVVVENADIALRCALAMQARQAELNIEAGPESRPLIGVGIGINTGTVIAGTLGGGGRLEYTVVGDAVNVAQRLQSEALAGEVLATAATIAAAPGFSVEPVGPRQVKGRKESVDVYRVLATRPESPS